MLSEMVENESARKFRALSVKFPIPFSTKDYPVTFFETQRSTVQLYIETGGSRDTQR